jgi:hypothetical protein
MVELWHPIKGYEGFYEISTKGRVRSLDRVIAQKNRWGSEMTYLVPSQEIKPKLYGLYLAVKLNNRGKKVKYIHRLVAEAFIFNPSDFKEVNHIDGDKYNNSDYNLEWVDRAKNHDHAYNTGLAHSGSKSHLAKLTEFEVAEILFLKETIDLQYNDLADIFGVTPEAVSKICRGISWSRPITKAIIDEHLVDLRYWHL